MNSCPRREMCGIPVVITLAEVACNLQVVSIRPKDAQEAIHQKLSLSLQAEGLLKCANCPVSVCRDRLRRIMASMEVAQAA